MILLDELVAFARQLPDDRFEAFLSFIQSLTEAAKNGARCVGHRIIAGKQIRGWRTEGGSGPGAAREGIRPTSVAVDCRARQRDLRNHSPPTVSDARCRWREGARRDNQGIPRSLQKNSAEFPPEAKEARYLELLRLSYPIHPELFDRLSKDWAALPLFQRTRGVLRFMANVVGVLCFLS